MSPRARCCWPAVLLRDFLPVSNAPIAGAIFALEAILLNIAIPLAVPVLIASASAAFVSSLIYKGQPFVLVTDSWNSAALPYYFGLSIFAALIAVYTVRMYHGIADRFARMRDPWMKAILGGTLLGSLILFFPPSLGEGYDSVENSARRSGAVVQLRPVLHAARCLERTSVLGLMLLKVVATSLTLGAGGNGGMFGPSLFIGGMGGFAFAHGMNVAGFGQLNEVNFTVVGMAAVLSGTIHVPLTAIFLIRGQSPGQVLFVPLMLVSSISSIRSRGPCSRIPSTKRSKASLPLGCRPVRQRNDRVPFTRRAVSSSHAVVEAFPRPVLQREDRWRVVGVLRCGFAAVTNTAWGEGYAHLACRSRWSPV